MHRAAVTSSLRVPAVLQPPLMAVSHNPLVDLADLVFDPVAVGCTLRSLRPAARGPVRCTLNGEPCYPITQRQWRHYLSVESAGRVDEAKRYLRRAIDRALNWERVRLEPGDLVVWHAMPQSKDTLRTVIAVVVAAVYVYFTWDAQGAASILGGIAYGTAVSNLLVPPSVAEQAQQQGGTVYSTSLTGNQARLDQPIWRNCGVVKINPPLAGQPYSVFIDSDGDNLDNDQYFYAVYAIGVGKHDVIRAFIGRTPIDSYQDVLVAQYLPPGTQPSRAVCNVVTSTEISGSELNSGEYVGGFVACQPQRKAASIDIDTACPSGLGKDGDLTVAWRVEWREIDDFGRPLTSWAVLGAESRTANTNTLQRWTVHYELPGAARPMVRLVRTDIKDTSSSARHSLQWVGMRAYLSEPAALDPNTAHFEVVMRASEQLSVQSQRDISMIVQAYARTWSTGTGWSCALHDWDNYTATRTPAWYLADLWVDPLWGEGRDEARVNLPGLLAFAQVNDERQDRLDYTFSEAINAQDAAQLIAGAGRARAFERLGVVTLARDELVTLPRTGFSPRNTTGTMSVNESTPRPPAVVDGIRLEYTSNVTWDIATIDCPAPGFTVEDEADPRYNPALPKMTAPLYLRVEGIKGAKHAERTGLYEAAKRFLRRRTVNCTTTMQGAVVAFMDAIRWQPEIAAIGESGDVAFWNAGTLVMGLTEPPKFSPIGRTWLTLMRDDGSLTAPVIVTPGPTACDVVLPAAPDFELVLADGTRERPKFFASYEVDEVMKITSIDDGGKSDAPAGEEGVQLYAISGFIDDERVHTADVHLLPGPGEIQDPVDDGTGAEAGGGTLPLVTLAAHGYPDLQDGSGPSGGGISVTVTLKNDGSYTFGRGFLGGGAFAGEWANALVEADVAGSFEVLATCGHPEWFTAGTFDVWQTLDVDRSWTLGNLADRIPVLLRLQIRDVASGIVQADKTQVLEVAASNLDG